MQHETIKGAFHQTAKMRARDVSSFHCFSTMYSYPSTYTRKMPSSSNLSYLMDVLAFSPVARELRLCLRDLADPPASGSLVVYQSAISVEEETPAPGERNAPVVECHPVWAMAQTCRAAFIAMAPSVYRHVMINEPAQCARAAGLLPAAKRAVQ